MTKIRPLSDLHLESKVADAQEGWKADLIIDSNFVTKSDEWLVRVLGPKLHIGTLRLFAYAGAFAAIGATLAYLVW